MQRTPVERWRLALTMRDGVIEYLRAKYGPDITWHPLFVETLRLFILLMEGKGL